MTGKTHILGGMTFAAGIAMAASFALKTPIDAAFCGSYLIASGVGGLLPDIDHRSSTISQNHKIAAFFVHFFFGHRGATHSPFVLMIVVLLGSIIMGIASPQIVSYLVSGFLIGYASHILLDALNPQGVPLLYPFVKKKYSVAKIRTGGLSEGIFFIVLLIVFVLIGYRLLLSYDPSFQNIQAVKDWVNELMTWFRN